MIISPTKLADVLLIEPRVFEDSRGFFFESFNRAAFLRLTGLDLAFVQDNHSRSNRSVLRGLHYQLTHPQGKLVRVISGEIWDIAVDLRRSSADFGQWVGVSLSAENRRQLWIPPGFGHGFHVTSDHAEVLYKTTDYWMPSDERCVRWDDPTLAIDWALADTPIVSVKDAAGQLLSAAEVFT